MKVKIILKLSLLAVILCMLADGCKKDESIEAASCAFLEVAPPRYMFAPDSVKTDSLITITIIYDNQQPCQRFDSFSSSQADSTTTIIIQTKIDSCDCQNQYGLFYRYFNYQAQGTPGHSIVRMHVVDTLFYSDTIVVY